jgi:hypothetical protein
VKKTLLTFVCLAAASLVACDEVPRSSAVESQRQQTAQIQEDAEARVGMPRITNFTEKRLANMVMELRDQPNLATYTYRTDMNGGAHCIGRSIGFGLPYTTQVTNPFTYETPGISERGTAVIAQAEPNGLYSSDSTNATCVLLVGADGKPKPAYVEDDVTVTLEPLPTAMTPCPGSGGARG